MSAIEFHTGVDEPLAYACRLLRKASRQRARVAVVGPASTMERLDTLLWTFEATSFVAHRRVNAPGLQRPGLDTPIWLMDDDTGSAAEGIEEVIEAGIDAAIEAGVADKAAMKQSPGFGADVAVGAPDVLLNLGDAAVRDASAWRRIIEIVPDDPSARQRARQRWRDYETRGLKPVHRAVNEAAS